MMAKQSKLALCASKKSSNQSFQRVLWGLYINEETLALQSLCRFFFAAAACQFHVGKGITFCSSKKQGPSSWAMFYL